MELRRWMPQPLLPPRLLNQFVGRIWLVFCAGCKGSSPRFAVPRPHPHHLESSASEYDSMEFLAPAPFKAEKPPPEHIEGVTLISLPSQH
jgi:hypothetical protein